MAVIGNPPQVVGGGEYGATTVHLSMDGGSLRIAFGRNGAHKEKHIYGAVLLSAEAVGELRAQLAAFDVAQ